MIKNIVLAAAIVVAGVGVTGAVVSSDSYAAEPNKSDTKNNESAEKNNVSYWEAQYPGSTCTKSEPGGKEFVVPALSSDKVYTAIIVKAGSESSVDDPNKVYESPKAGDKLTAPEGKDISHVIVCTKPAGGSGGGTTPTTPTTPVGGSGTTAPVTPATQAPTVPAPTVSGRGSAVASLPVTSGSNTQVIALTALLGSALAGAATYVVRARSSFSL